jgi:ubiquinone biosynthesis protein UbiJ
MASPLDLLGSPARPAAALLNHLLRGQPWLRERLVPFAGRGLRIEAAPLPALQLAIEPSGELRDAPEAGAEAAVRLSPATLLRLAAGDDSARAAVDVSGDAALAAALAAVLRELRWDAEEDLSRLVGDIPARRIVQLAEGFAVWQRRTLASLLAAAAEYLVEERRILPARGAVQVFAQDVDTLRDDVERLGQRLDRLSRIERAAGDPR